MSLMLARPHHRLAPSSDHVEGLLAKFAGRRRCAKEQGIKAIFTQSSYRPGINDEK